jgi:hypothetical protein
MTNEAGIALKKRNYRGCSYAKFYEVMDEEGSIINHEFSASGARRCICRYLAKTAVGK